MAALSAMAAASNLAAHMSPPLMGEEAGAMPYVMVDVESDGPIPGDYSMICVGAVLVQEGLRETFYGRLRPI